MIEDMYRECPAQYFEALHLGPSAIGNKQGIGTDIEGRALAEFPAPQLYGAHMFEMFIEHMRHHAKRIRKITVVDLILEVGDDDRAEITTHDTDCFAPIKRSRPGC